MFLFLATLRSGYMLQDSAEFAQTVEELMRETLGIPKDLGVRLLKSYAIAWWKCVKSAKSSLVSVDFTC